MNEQLAAAILEARNITKRFPGVVALQRVNFNVRGGEVHAIMGENGAGKSTLIKVLTGIHPRDEGEIEMCGEPISPQSPRDAEAVGISTVYQEVNLLPDLTVAENICLGRTGGILSWKKMRQRARAALARVGLDSLEVSQTLSSCSIAVQQLVAIARAIDIQAKILILDEPTSSLDEGEVEELFKVVRRLRDSGMGIIFVTHFLDQVYALADRITVLRNGCFVGEYVAKELPRLQLVAHMLGRSLSEVEELQKSQSTGHVAGKVVLKAIGLGRKGSVKPFDLELRSGEVVGLAGLLGSGRSEVARLLFGIDHADSGKLLLDDKELSRVNPRTSLLRRLGFTPEDRKTQAILPGLTVRENLLIALQAYRGIWRRISKEEQTKLVDQYIKLLGIRTSGPEQLISQLSGGNQQKVILARWLITHPRVLILDEPTRGIDVGAQADIQHLIQQLRDEGLAVVFICADIAELVRNSQRLAVMRDANKVAELQGDEVNEPSVMQAIADGSNGSDK